MTTKLEGGLGVRALMVGLLAEDLFFYSLSLIASLDLKAQSEQHCCPAQGEDKDIE